MSPSACTTLGSMLSFLGVYWSMFGWKFALGFVICIYVHEMGHVAELRRFGIAASAPMFIPGLGAFVSLKQLPANVTQDSRVGVVGPIWGLGAAAICSIAGAGLSCSSVMSRTVTRSLSITGAWASAGNVSSGIASAAQNRGLFMDGP